MHALTFEHATRQAPVITATTDGHTPAKLIVRSRRARSATSRLKVVFAHVAVTPDGARVVAPVAEFRIELN